MGRPRKKDPRGGPRPGSGRKPKIGEARRKYLFVRVSEMERAELTEMAEAEGKTVSDLIRSRVFKKDKNE